MYVYKPYSDSPYNRGGVHVGGGGVEAVASTLGQGNFRRLQGDKHSWKVKVKLRINHITCKNTSE